MKILLASLIATVAAIPAFADPALHPHPAPAPELAVGGPAVLAIIGAYVIARLMVRRNAAKAVAS